MDQPGICDVRFLLGYVAGFMSREDGVFYPVPHLTRPQDKEFRSSAGTDKYVVLVFTLKPRTVLERRHTVPVFLIVEPLP